MKPTPHWPLHPAPREGEALSSWLNRVAACYHMDVHELLAHDLGHDQLDDLDIAPPSSLLIALAQRSGVELERLRSMSLGGWGPWLLDSLDDSLPAALETYAFQCSVLLPKRKVRSITRWLAWLPSQPIRRACPLCLNDPASQAVLLAWQLPLMLSCPQHGCWLEPYWGLPGRYLQWENVEAAPRPANEATSSMDRRSWQALTTGFVELPRRRIHAGLWFRLLRTLLDELNTPLSHCGGGAGSVRQVWEHCGHPLRAGQSLWRPFEVLAPVVQVQMKALRSGDTLVVWKLDRLGRDLRYLINTMHDLTGRGVGLKVLTGHGAAIDTTTAAGKLVLGIFAALAEFERELIAERTVAGLASARARGRKGGRPFKMTAAKLRLATAAMGQPETKVGDLCQELGVTRQTLYRHLSPKGELRPDGAKLLGKL